MAKPIRTTLRKILLRLKDQLTTSLILPGQTDPIPSERVLLSMRRKVQHLQADQDVVLRPRGFRVVAKITDQAGRIDTRLQRRLEVRCRTRLATDDPARDETWLTDEVLGHVAFEELVCDCFQEFLPTESDQSQDVLLVCPMLLEEGSDPEPDTDGASRESGWGQTSLFFQMEYMLANSSYPR